MLVSSGTGGDASHIDVHPRRLVCRQWRQLIDSAVRTANVNCNVLELPYQDPNPNRLGEEPPPMDGGVSPVSNLFPRLRPSPILKFQSMLRLSLSSLEDLKVTHLHRLSPADYTLVGHALFRGPGAGPDHLSRLRSLTLTQRSLDNARLTSLGLTPDGVMKMQSLTRLDLLRHAAEGTEVTALDTTK